MYKDKILKMTDEELTKELEHQGDILNSCPEFDTRSKYNCVLKEFNRRKL